MPAQEGNSQALLEYIVKSLVDEPDVVSVTESSHGRETILHLSVSQPDMGRVIGKNGRVINSIRALVQVAAAKEGRQASIEIVEH